VAALGTARRKDEGAGVCALLPNDQKDTRAKRDKRQHWAVLVDGEPRIGEHPDLLAAELAMCVTEPLLAKMTAADFKKRVDAVADLLTSAAVAPQAALDSMDVLLKWMTLCFCEGTRSWAVCWLWCCASRHGISATGCALQSAQRLNIHARSLFPLHLFPVSLSHSSHVVLIA
jgi:hypothetical protein